MVEAAYDQMRMINSNTRYMHANPVNYANRLRDLMPSSEYVGSPRRVNSYRLGVSSCPAFTPWDHQTVCRVKGANLDTCIALQAIGVLSCELGIRSQ